MLVGVVLVLLLDTGYLLRVHKPNHLEVGQGQGDNGDHGHLVLDKDGAQATSGPSSHYSSQLHVPTRNQTQPNASTRTVNATLQNPEIIEMTTTGGNVESLLGRRYQSPYR